MKYTQYDAVHEYIEKILPLIEQAPSPRMPHPFLSISYGKHYSGGIFCWDNHHMSMRLAIAGKPDYLRYTVDNLLHYQTADGFTPNCVSSLDGATLCSPGFHAQPFMMQGALIYLSKTGNVSWLKKTYPKLTKYLQYYETNHRAPHGLFRWAAPWMSGFDNDVVTTLFPLGTIISVDLNAWMYLEYLAASKLARLLHLPEEEASFQTKARELRKAVNELLWVEEESTYAAYNLSEDRPQLHLRDKYLPGVGKYAFQTCSNLIPLYAHMADHEMAERMLRNYVLHEQHFLSAYGIRSLSRTSHYYNNAVWGNPPRFTDPLRLTNSNWQGPVWVPLCYFMFNALIDYGLRKEAENLADRTVAMLAAVLQKKGSFAENFDAETGDGLYCDKLASWNILADTMHPRLSRNTWIMDPIFSPEEETA